MRKIHFLSLLTAAILTLLCLPQNVYASPETEDLPQIVVIPEATAAPSTTTAAPDTTAPTVVAPEAPQVPEIPEPTPAYIVVHNVSNTCFVYDANLQLIKGFFVSTGAPGHETPLGTYQIYQHTTSGYHLMVDGTYGRYCMRFKDGGYMFHSVCFAYAGAPEPIPEEVAALGTSVSRGCVRLSLADAEWLYRATPNGCTVLIVND